MWSGTYCTTRHHRHNKRATFICRSCKGSSTGYWPSRENRDTSHAPNLAGTLSDLRFGWNAELEAPQTLGSRGSGVGSIEGCSPGGNVSGCGCVVPGGLGELLDAFPALKRWAFLWRARGAGPFRSLRRRVSCSLRVVHVML